MLEFIEFKKFIEFKTFKEFAEASPPYSSISLYFPFTSHHSLSFSLFFLRLSFGLILSSSPSLFAVSYPPNSYSVILWFVFPSFFYCLFSFSFSFLPSPSSLPLTGFSPSDVHSFSFSSMFVTFSFILRLLPPTASLQRQKRTKQLSTSRLIIRFNIISHPVTWWINYKSNSR